MTRVGILFALVTVLTLSPAAARAQEAVEAAYRDALAVTPLPRTLAAEHDAWRGWRGEVEPGARDTLDADRLDELRTGEAVDRAMRAWSTPRAEFGAVCPPLGLEDCQVVEGGFLRRPLEDGLGDPLHWLRLRGSGAWGGRIEGVVLLAGNDRLVPVVWASRAFWHEPPQVAEDGDDDLLALPATHDGTGRMNADLLFRWTVDGRFIEIDQGPFRAQLDAALPPGLEIWKGLLFHWPAMMAETSLWRASDANCCPSGGEAWMDLRVEGETLVLAAFVPRDSLLQAIEGHSVDMLTWAALRKDCQRAREEADSDALACPGLREREAALLADLDPGDPDRQAVARIRAATPRAD